MPEDMLGEPLVLPCGARLSNRLCKAAMTEGLADSLNRATERHLRLYRRWSRGGAGLLISGNVQIDRRHLERAGNIAIDGNNGTDQLRALAKAGTEGGNHLWMQISHAGRQTPAAVNPTPLAPSAVPLHVPLKGFGSPTAMTEADIRDVIARFTRAAATAREVGFTGVQIHSAHGYLLSSFLTPNANLREDSWGGPIENRARLLLEVVRSIRVVVGDDFPVSVKLNSTDFQHAGFVNDECIQLVAWLSDLKIDLLEISGGNYESVFSGEEVPLGGDPTIIKSTLKREAFFLEYAERIRPTAKMPLMVTGGFRSRAAMEAALRSGATDVIGIAGPLCVDPDTPRKLLDGASGCSAPAQLLTLSSEAGPTDDPKAFRALQGWAQLYWSYFQLLRLGDGQDANLSVSLGEALSTVQANEAACALALSGR